MQNPYLPPASTEPRSQPAPTTTTPGQPTAGLKAMGAIQIIFGALGFFSAPLTLLMRNLAGHDPVSRRIQEVTWEGGFGMWMRFALFVQTLIAVTLLASGVGVLKLRPWARTSSMVYAIAACVMNVVGQIANFMVLIPELQRIADEHPRSPAAQGGAIGGMVGGVLGGILGLALPVITLVVMTRPSVKAQFGVQS
jgi:hypothetical protein